MKRAFHDFLSQVDLSPLSEYCREHGSVVRYAKGERMAQEGDLCRVIGIVQSGYFKYTSLSANGDECVTGFSFVGEAVTDYVRSFLCNRQALTSIVAGCDSEVLQVSITEVRPYMLQCNPAFISEASSILLQEAYRRYLAIHTMSPSQRYVELFTRYHESIAVIPHQELASYLMISRRQFQRIRENVAQNLAGRKSER